MDSRAYKGDIRVPIYLADVTPFIDLTNDLSYDIGAIFIRVKVLQSFH